MRVIIQSQMIYALNIRECEEGDSGGEEISDDLINEYEWALEAFNRAIEKVITR